MLLTGLEAPLTCIKNFPFIVKATHLKEFRLFLEKKWKLPFLDIYLQYFQDNYFQLDILCSYLWWNKNDDYSWYIDDISPKWNGFSPLPSWAQWADKSIFPTQYFTPKPNVLNRYVSHHKDEQYFIHFENILIESYCWQNKSFSIFLDQDKLRKNIITSNIHNEIDFQLFCSNMLQNNTYNKNMFIFESIDMNKVYSDDVIRVRELFTSFDERQKRIQSCIHN